jgi:glycosyltransferase involved in cell wall biosynthesis
MEKQLHICHISILNPAIHSRIFFKMALSQVEAGYKVSIIAQDDAKAPYERAGVTIIPIGIFGRMNWRRVFFKRIIQKKALALKADFYQIHAVELLEIGKRLKKELPNSKVVWDMHEDYVANILFADYYAKSIRNFLAKRVKAVQSDFCTWGDGLILAEECFDKILDFPKSKTAILRNKYQAPSSKFAALENPENLPILLYTGTIAENWGIIRALELLEILNKRRPVMLVIAGHSQNHEILDDIDEFLDENNLSWNCICIGGKDYVPFEEIVGLIQNCTLGLALYDPKANIKDRIPTKFYEFMANNKPLLFTSNSTWNALNDRLGFGMAIDWPPTESQIDEIEKRFLAGTEVQSSPIPEVEWSWKTEKAEMIAFFQRI